MIFVELDNGQVGTYVPDSIYPAARAEDRARALVDGRYPSVPVRMGRSTPVLQMNPRYIRAAWVKDPNR